MAFGNITFPHPQYPNPDHFDTPPLPQIAKCDCRCGLLTGVVVVATHISGSYSKTGGYADLDSDGNQTGSGKVYDQEVCVYSYSGTYQGQPQGVAGTSTTTYSYDRTNNKYTQHNVRTSDNLGGDLTITWTMSNEYSDSDLVSDATAKFNLLPFPDPEVDDRGNVLVGTANPALGSGVDDTFSARNLSSSVSISGTGDERTVKNFTNTSDGTLIGVTYTSLKYMLVLSLGTAWKGDGGLELLWRDRTDTYSATATKEGTNDSIYEESGTPEFSDGDFSSSPAEGSFCVKTQVFTYHATDLALGQTRYPTGPEATVDLLNSLLPPVLQLAVSPDPLGSFGQKYGFSPFIRVNPTTSAVPIYLTVTASGTSTDGKTTYSGSLTFSAGVGYPSSNTFHNVPYFVDSADILDIEPAVPLVTPQQVTFDTGLILTLSQEDTNSALVDRVNTFQQHPHTPVVGAGGYESSGVAERYFSPDNQVYRTFASPWYLYAGVNLPIQKSIISRVQTATVTKVYSFSGSVAVTYTRSLVNLDTGERGGSPTSASISFDGDNDGTVDDPVWEVDEGIADAANPQTETVPGANQLILVDEIAYSSVDGGEGIALPICAQIAAS